MSAHTPGPWRFTGAKARRILVNVHGGRITYTDDDMSAANERLIAAAPELYEVVRLLLYVAEHGPHDPSPLDENSPLMDAARDALAKVDA